MSPKRVETKKILPDPSLQKYEFPRYDISAILELSSLLGINPETLIFHLVTVRNYELAEGVFTSRLRRRFQGMKSKQPTYESIEDIFQKSGLAGCFSSKAWNYVLSKCSLEDNHLDIIDWVVLYVQDLIHYSLFPERVLGKFRYQESTVNFWFGQPRGEGDEACGEVNMLNMIGKKKKLQVEPLPLLRNGKRFPQGIEEEGHQLFYHGTDHESAENIFKEGINLRKGQKNMDLSHGKGFYLDNDFEGEGVSWALQKKKKKAILIFKIPGEVLDPFRRTSKNLFNNEAEWLRISNQFRSNPTEKSFRKEMKPVSFIEGPIAGKRDAVKIRRPIEGSYQMCLHSDDLAKKFDLHLHSIVFYE